MTDPLIGQVIAARYEVLRLIGKGGMGAIYEVKHTRLPRRFALKKLSAALADDPEALARFRREADVVASLRHPNVVEIVDWETLDDGAPCMIMEFLAGEDVGARLAKRGPLDWQTLGRVADEVMSALGVAHRAGVVHRDLKPQNIFLSRDDAGDERAKLLDFGVSKVRHAESLITTQGAQLLGTPAYMSPEQANGEADTVGPDADVWAMGAILIEMATAKRAFTAGSTPAILYRIVHGEPEPILKHRPDAPPAFVELVARALAKEPKDRIADIEELRTELRAALGGVATFRQPTTGRDRSPGAIEPKPRAPDPPSTLSRAAGEPSLPGDAPPPRSRALLWAMGGIILGGAAIAGAVLKLAPHSAGTHAVSGPTVSRIDRVDAAMAAPAPPAPPPVSAPASVAVVASSVAPAHPPHLPVTSHHASPAVAIASTAVVPPAPPAPPQAPPWIDVSVAVQPVTASLELDGAPTGPRLALPRDGKTHTLAARAPGFESQTIPLDEHTGSSVSIRLKRIAPAVPPGSNAPPPPLPP
jgi:serine/threonine-protein kinase